MEEINQRKRIAIVSIISLVLLVIIIPAKRATFAHFGSTSDSASSEMSIDDTAFVASSLPDSAIIGDDRPVDRAGFEDGYTSGSTDAAMRQGRGTYDEHNPYPTGERDAYINGYREGYKQGQTFGSEHPAAGQAGDHRSIEDLVRESDERLK